MAHDTLSDVLRGVRLRGAVFFNVSGSRDWAAEAPPSREIAPLLMPGAEHVIEYHAVAQGSCWATIPGGPSVRLGPGDAVMFPHGDAHVVSSSPGLRGRLDFSFMEGVGADPFPLHLAYSGLEVAQSTSPDSAAETTVVCGFLACDLQPFNPLIAALPRSSISRPTPTTPGSPASRSRRSPNRIRAGPVVRRCWRG